MSGGLLSCVVVVLVVVTLLFSERERESACE